MNYALALLSIAAAPSIKYTYPHTSDPLPAFRTPYTPPQLRQEDEHLQHPVHQEGMGLDIRHHCQGPV